MTRTIKKGETYRCTYRPETQTQRYVEIAGISLTAPALIDAPAHGMVEGWRFAITGAKGLTQLNAEMDSSGFLPREQDYFQGQVVDTDTIKIDEVNATAFPPYIGGGILQYGAPMDLNACSIRAQIRGTSKASPLLLDMTPYATTDIGLCRFDFNIPSAITSALVGESGVLGVEIVDSSGAVISLPNESVIFEKEIARE